MFNQSGEGLQSSRPKECVTLNRIYRRKARKKNMITKVTIIRLCAKGASEGGSWRLRGVAPNGGATPWAFIRLDVIISLILIIGNDLVYDNDEGEVVIIKFSLKPLVKVTIA